MIMNTQDTQIIAVTGTKGKTTTVAVISDVLKTLGKNVLKVDTTGHFVNGERKSTLDDSKAVWRLVPSVCPGRYLWEFHSNPELKENGVAVLECSLGCSATSGLGYRYHTVGVFLNVFEDHLGSSDRIKTREDIAIAKSFIFSRLTAAGSSAVFNADDELVVKMLAKIPETARPYVTLLPCGLTFEHFDIKAHLASGGSALTVNDNHEIILKNNQGETVLVDLTQIPWTFDGKFGPSVWNILSAVGALYGYFEGQLPSGFREAFEAVRLDQYGGRLTLLSNDQGVKILADYAHEKISLGMVADLARTKLGDGGRVIGVVRLAHDRSDELMQETGRVIAAKYNEVVVYDKIDGYLRQPSPRQSRFMQVTGRTSQILFDAITESNPNATRIIREDEAIAYAAEIARPGDVVVIIVNDNIERSIGFIKEKFSAEFI